MANPWFFKRPRAPGAVHVLAFPGTGTKHAHLDISSVGVRRAKGTDRVVGETTVRHPPPFARFLPYVPDAPVRANAETLICCATG